MTAHWTTTPSAILDAMLAAIAAPLQKSPSNPTGTVLTVARVEDDNKEAIDRACYGGLPALLLYDAGGAVEDGATHQQEWSETIRFRLIAVAGELRTARERLQGTSVGVEDLCNLGLYYALRGAAALTGVRGAWPLKRTQSVVMDAGKWCAAWDLQCKRSLDIFDEDPAAVLETLGLVHSPYGSDMTKATPGNLFQPDNLTPKQTPPEVGGGVTEL